MAFTGKDGPSNPPGGQAAGMASTQQPRRTDTLIQHSSNLADELRGLHYRLNAVIGSMVSPQPADPVVDRAEVASIEAKRPALEQIDWNLEQIREQTIALSHTIGELELL